LGDIQADPGAVFLYRQEPREVAQLLGADMARFNGPLVPVIFSISFRDPGGYFLATRLQMRNDDVIFVANAQSVDTSKFLTFVNLVTSAAIGTAAGIQSVPITSQVVHGHAFGAAFSNNVVVPTTTTAAPTPTPCRHWLQPLNASQGTRCWS
jgi:polysaccharide biosynthesis/export protein